MHTIVHIHVSSNVYGRIHRVMSITTNININTYTNYNDIFQEKGIMRGNKRKARYLCLPPYIEMKGRRE